MFNSHLAGIDVFIIVLNLIGVTGAIYWNFKASKDGEFAKTMLKVTVLAGIYFFAYSLLLFSEIDPSAWSSIFRGLAVLVWYYVWILPARSWIDHKEQLGQRLEEEIGHRIGGWRSGQGED